MPVRVHTPSYRAFFAYTAGAEIQRMHSKLRMVIVSTNFGSKQSYEIGSRTALK